MGEVDQDRYKGGQMLDFLADFAILATNMAKLAPPKSIEFPGSIAVS